jgi:hypothetical protein
MFRIRPKEILPEPTFVEGIFQVRRPRLYKSPLPSSSCTALEGIADKARGLTGFNALIDEAAFTKELRGTYQAMSPAMQYIQLVSSPSPGEFQQCFTIGIGEKKF